MCQAKDFTKTHKQIIKKVELTIGPERPYTVELTQSSHLKFMIEGALSPLYTGGTPSDRRATSNFISEVKRAIRAKPEEAIEISSTTLVVMKQTSKACFDRILQDCTKYMRQRIDVMKKSELALIEELQRITDIDEFRTQEVKNVTKRHLQMRKVQVYLKPKEIKQLEKSCRKHLDFFLPSLSHYADLVKKGFIGTEATIKSVNKTSISLNTNRNVSHITETVVKHSTLAQKKLQLKEQANRKPSAQPEKNTVVTDASVNHQYGVHEIAAMAKHKRIELFRQLNKHTMQMFIEDFEQAMMLNQELAISHVIEQIKVQDIPVDLLLTKLGVVA